MGPMSLRTLLTALVACAFVGGAWAQVPASVVLEGDHGYAQTRERFPPGAVIDATRGTWRLNNSKNADPRPGRSCKQGDLPTNPYPLRINGAEGGLLIGGRIVGETPQRSPRGETYCNSAGLLVQAPEFTVRGVRVERAWDGIRTKPPQGSWVRLEGVMVDGARDDCLENDNLSTLDVRDSLFDGCFMGFSLDPGRCDRGCGKGRASRYIFDRVLLRVTPYPVEAREGGVEVKSGIFLKASDPTPATIEITNSVFAFEDIAPRMYERMARSWDKLGRCEGNRLLYLGGEALPKDFPRPPACFTVVTGERARREWAQARAGWLAAHPAMAEVR